MSSTSSSSRGQQLFDNFLRKAAICGSAVGDKWYPAMLEVYEARKALERYLSPPRDNKGRFLPVPKEQSNV